MSLSDVFDEHAFARMFSGVPVQKAPTDAAEHEPFITPDLGDVKAARMHATALHGRPLVEV